jgi:antitoxin YefM
VDISYSQIRQNLKKIIDWTTNTREPAFITSHKDRKAVLLSYDDYCSLEETAYLLKSPVNAQRLLQSISDVNHQKNVKSQNLIDE